MELHSTLMNLKKAFDQLQETTNTLRSYNYELQNTLNSLQQENHTKDLYYKTVLFCI